MERLNVSSFYLIFVKFIQIYEKTSLIVFNFA